VVVTLWSGPQVVRRLGPDDSDPSAEELDAIATAMTAPNDGVRPVVRVVEVATVPRRSLGAAGSVPR